MKKIIKFPKLEPWQKDSFNEISVSYRNGKTYVILAKRQCGKSVECELLLIYFALTYPNTTSIILSPTNGQNRKIFKDITTMLSGSDTISSANATYLEITFSNGSQILCKSAEQREALRGETVSGLFIIDEAASIPQDIFDITNPWTDANNAPKLIVSTPKFKSGAFYDAFNDVDSVTFNWTKYDTSKFLTPERLDKYRQKMPAITFAQEYLGQFMDLQGSVFGDFSKIVKPTLSTEETEVIGIDWGSGTNGDYTAIVGLSKNKKMTYLDYFNNLDPNETICRILDALKEKNPKTIIVEKNSIGKVYGDLLKSKVNRPITWFNTTNDSKNRIIDNLQLAIQNSSIELLNNQELMSELATYEIQQTKSGKTTYNAMNGCHDDLVMALAFALDAFKSNKYAVI